MPAVREVVWLDDTSGPEGLLHFEDLTNYEPALDVGAANDDLAGLFYTGGTTGRSKGVMLSHTNLVVNALNGVAGIGFSSDTTYIHSGPMFHLADGASTFGVTMAGGRHAFVPRFEPVEVLQTIQTEKVTHAQFVPTMINMIVNHPRFAEFDIRTLQLHPLRRLADARGRAAPGHAGDAACETDACLRHDRGGAHRDAARPALHDARGAVRRQAEIVRPGGARLRDQGRRRQARGGAARHGGRACDPRRQHHEGLLEKARRDRSRSEGRLVLLRRRRLHGRRGLRLHRRPPQGHDHLGRRERLFRRGRERDLAADGRQRSRGDRHTRRALGRARARHHRPQARRHAQRRRRDRSTAATRSPATSARAASTSATRRCRSRAPARC